MKFPSPWCGKGISPKIHSAVSRHILTGRTVDAFRSIAGVGFGGKGLVKWDEKCRRKRQQKSEIFPLTTDNPKLRTQQELLERISELERLFEIHDRWERSL